MNPRTILKASKAMGLDVVAIVDHGTIRGGLETKKLAKDMGIGVEVVIGAEISTDIGDVVGLFLNHEVRSREVRVVIDDIKDQDGLILLPHPLKGHCLELMRQNIRHFDLVELLNARAPITRKDASTIKELGRKLVGCSDAHFSKEIGLCRTLIYDVESQSFDDLINILRKCETKVIGQFTFPYLKSSSELIKAIKYIDIKQVPFLTVQTMYEVIKHCLN